MRTSNFQIDLSAMGCILYHLCGVLIDLLLQRGESRLFKSIQILLILSQIILKAASLSLHILCLWQDSMQLCSICNKGYILHLKEMLHGMLGKDVANRYWFPDCIGETLHEFEPYSRGRWCWLHGYFNVRFWVDEASEKVDWWTFYFCISGLE